MSYVNNQITNFSPNGEEGEVVEVAAALAKYEVANVLFRCKARYSVLFQIRTFPPEPEDEAHIGPTVTYDKAIYPRFQHDIIALQIQGYNISSKRHTAA